MEAMTAERKAEILSIARKFQRRDYPITANVAADLCVELVEAMENLEARTAVTVEVSPHPPPPNADVSGGPMGLMSYQPRRFIVLAKKANPEDPSQEWVGAITNTMHTVTGPDEGSVRRRLEEAVGRG